MWAAAHLSVSRLSFLEQDHLHIAVKVCSHIREGSQQHNEALTYIFDAAAQVKAKRAEQAGHQKERMLLERKIAKKRAQVDKKVPVCLLSMLSCFQKVHCCNRGRGPQ